VADGQPWEAIADEWRGAIKVAAIAEAVRIATQAFADHAEEYTAA